jgi:hypothetical protein
MSEEQKNSGDVGGLQIKKLITYYNKGAQGNTGAIISKDVGRMSVFDMDSCEDIDSDEMSDIDEKPATTDELREATEPELVDNGDDDNEEMVNKRATFIDEIDARMSHF